MYILREVVDLAKHLAWAVLMGGLVELFSFWLPIWVSIILALALAILLALVAWKWLGWNLWRRKRP